MKDNQSIILGFSFRQRLNSDEALIKDTLNTHYVYK